MKFCHCILGIFVYMPRC